jgi:hypothetical protein
MLSGNALSNCLNIVTKELEDLEKDLQDFDLQVHVVF